MHLTPMSGPIGGRRLMGIVPMINLAILSAVPAMSTATALPISSLALTVMITMVVLVALSE